MYSSSKACGFYLVHVILYCLHYNFMQTFEMNVKELLLNNDNDYNFYS